MIVTEDLTKQFDDFLAVDKVNLHINAGEVLALLGPNGAGKTTTVRMLSSVLRPTQGRASIAGYDVATQAAQVRASVGVLTENHGLYNRMPAAEYLDFFGEIYQLDVKTRRARIKRLLDDFGLASAKKRRIGEFSKGMRQKLALARALLHRPPVLLLDEPTSAMDPESARLVRDSIRELRSEERAIILCTHNLAEAEELSDRIAIIRKGKIVAGGTPGALKQSYLGPPVYEVRLGRAFNDARAALPADIAPTAHGENWFRFASSQAEETNPAVLQALLSHNIPVLSLHRVPRSLEAVYLQVMAAANGQEVRNVG